ncbi:MAG TPA: MaoC family dehydratase [Rugosimonospora sp.]|nr:MaoC family dehydratase [Rugosimonospora sp.]
MTVFSSVHALRGAAGTDLGYSDWVLVDQERVNRFADATDDHQWIHVDPELARSGPFGGTIAHGYLTLAMVVPLMANLFRVEGVRMGINYGVNRVRFPAPVPVGSKIRARGEVLTVDEVEGGVQVTNRVTIEREGGEKPVCVAETVVRLYL